jgi:DNA integrity scanning protein DisA with diadenylate cyclase activity
MQFKLKHFLIAFFVFVAEILVATTFSHIRFIRSSISDFLVTILLYHLIKAFIEMSPLTLSIGVFVFSCLVEILQYFHLGDMLGLPRGSLLSILLGTNFSWLDILMYFLGCVTSYCLDSFYLSKKKTTIV